MNGWVAFWMGCLCLYQAIRSTIGMDNKRAWTKCEHQLL
jgi:hypothetical protein